MADNLENIYDSRSVSGKEELELDELQKEVEKMNIINQMWLTTVSEIEGLRPYNSWDGEYDKEDARLILKVCDCLSVYGYDLKKEDEQFLNGVGELKEQLEQIEEELKELDE